MDFLTAFLPFINKITLNGYYINGIPVYRNQGNHSLCFEIIQINLQNHWSCITHPSAEDLLKSAVIEEKKFKNIESA